MSWSRRGVVHESVVETLPQWLEPIVRATETVDVETLTSFIPSEGSGRHSAVLMLFGDQEDLLLIERAHDSTTHSGQPAFPGGVIEPHDLSPTHAALREANEETGLDPSGVTPFGLLPDLWIPVSNFVVTPVLGWWKQPSEVYPVDPREVASVHRIAIEEFVNPENRVRVSHPSGYVGDGFQVHDLVVWGFTAGIISTMVRLAGWERPWDQSRVIPVPVSSSSSDDPRRTHS
jgi:8-oxo-dGTP pyrophosphatase MutT (NUDIX family)